MTTIAILPADPASPESGYRAISGSLQSVGRTAGEALDGMMAQLGDDAKGTLAVVQPRRPDAFFTAQQQQRLADLMARWRAARDNGTHLSAAEQAELEALVQAEVRGAGARAAALLGELGS